MKGKKKHHLRPEDFFPNSSDLQISGPQCNIYQFRHPHNFWTDTQLLSSLAIYTETFGLLTQFVRIWRTSGSFVNKKSPHILREPAEELRQSPTWGLHCGKAHGLWYNTHYGNRHLGRQHALPWLANKHLTALSQLQDYVIFWVAESQEEQCEKSWGCYGRNRSRMERPKDTNPQETAVTLLFRKQQGSFPSLHLLPVKVEITHPKGRKTHTPPSPEEAQLYNSRAIFSPGKRMKSAIYTGQITSSRKHTRHTKRAIVSQINIWWGLSLLISFVNIVAQSIAISGNAWCLFGAACTMRKNNKCT